MVCRSKISALLGEDALFLPGSERSSQVPPSKFHRLTSGHRLALLALLIAQTTFLRDPTTFNFFFRFLSFLFFSPVVYSSVLACLFLLVACSLWLALHGRLILYCCSVCVIAMMRIQLCLDVCDHRSSCDHRSRLSRRHRHGHWLCWTMGWNIIFTLRTHTAVMVTCLVYDENKNTLQL